ncbi:MAG: hypothetical protein JW804_06375 [Sedimentisphaerales bacterium]|nr:hypothetical protein [Sedimentisphaerales bacterium]
MLTKALNPSHLLESLRNTRPQTKRNLKNYIKVFLGLDIPDKTICQEHNTPLDYLWHAFSSDFKNNHSTQYAHLSAVASAKAERSTSIINADCIVWANRAGGKTELAAVATLLDCIFKPSCQIRILAGSGEQSMRMYEYFLNFLRNGFAQYLQTPARKEKCTFENGSAVEVLNQSATSIRGWHIHKLRCDEVELFTNDVLNAAKFTTQTKNGILAAMEVISTMHRPYGQMQKLVSDAQKNNTPIFKWCIFETIEKCKNRSCSQCPLWNDCRAKAKNAAGYLKIDDVITQMKRSSRAGFESEMLCLRPSLENAVFSEFDPDIHVKPLDYNPSLPLFRSIDFGFVNPFVCLWLQTDDNGTVRIIDEYIKSRVTINIHAKEIIDRTPCPQENVTATFCDPAGAAANDVTGTSAVKELKNLGIKLRYRRSSILQGIELIRRAIKDGSRQSKLIISPKCTKLIEALRCYHYPETSGNPTELPLKDGIYDHPIDALRYFFINQKEEKIKSRRY